MSSPGLQSRLGSDLQPQDEYDARRIRLEMDRTMASTVSFVLTIANVSWPLLALNAKLSEIA